MTYTHKYAYLLFQAALRWLWKHILTTENNDYVFEQVSEVMEFWLCPLDGYISPGVIHMGSLNSAMPMLVAVAKW